MPEEDGFRQLTRASGFASGGESEPVLIWEGLGKLPQRTSGKARDLAIA